MSPFEQKDSLVGHKNTLVTLVRGPIVFADGSLNNEAVPALGLAYIAGYLRMKGYKVEILDAIAEDLNKAYPLKKYPGFSCQGLSPDKVISKIPKHSNVIAFSGMFSGEWPVLRDLITQTRELFPEALLVAGGEHITALSEYCLHDCSAIDVCVRGEGENTFYELLKAYLTTGSFLEVPGIAYLNKEGEYQQNGIKTPRIHDIDKLPWPYWPEGYLEKFWKAGKSYGAATERDMPFMLSRGCPFQCTFCSNLLMWNTKYQFRNLDDVMAEIKHYIDRYSITSIQLYDLTAIIKKTWALEFCQRMIDEGFKIKWSLPAGTRSEALDHEVLPLLKKSDCNYLVYAPESGSLRTLKKIKKRVKLDRLTESVLEAKRQGLVVRINLIVGFPHETWWDVIQTLLYGVKMSFRGVDEVPLFVFSPYPGTEIFDELLKDGKVKLNDDYFFKLTSLNSAYFSTNVEVFCENVSGRLLGLVRSTFIMLNYAIGYFLYPKRILRTIRNINSEAEAATVLEHRLKDLFNRKKSTDSVT